MFTEDNPCNDCLVKACCTKLCESKLKYTDILITHLTYFIDKYTIQKRGMRYPSTKRVPTYQQKEWDRVRKLCQSNQEETFTIHMRRK